MNFAHRVLYDGLYTFVMRMLNVVCAAGLGILTARLLGPAGKGIYALPSVEAGLITAGFTGLGSALSYFLLNRRASTQVLRPALAVSTLFVVVGALAIIPIAMLGGQHWTAWPAIVSLPASAAINLVSGFAIGTKRVRYATSISVATTVLTLLLMAAGLFFVSRSPAIAIAVWIVANIVIGLVGFSWMIWHARELKGDEAVPVREFLRFSIKVGAVQLISLLNYRADLYIVALLTNAASLGMYTVAVSAAESLLVPTQVAALVTSPHIGSLDRDAAAHLTARCVRNNLLVALVVCGLLFAFARPVVHLLYGSAFLPVVPVLQVILAGVFALSLGSPMSSYFTLKVGRPEVPMWLAGSSAAICIAVSIALVPSMGMMGAAIGSTVAYACGQVAAIWYFSKTAAIGVPEILVPTAADMSVYRGFLTRILADGRALLGPSTHQT